MAGIIPFVTSCQLQANLFAVLLSSAFLKKKVNKKRVFYILIDLYMLHSLHSD